MTLKLNMDGNKMFKMTLERQLNKSGLEFQLNGFNEISLKDDLEDSQIEELKSLLSSYGIEIIVEKNLKIHLIKKAIKEMLTMVDFNTIKISKYLSKKLNYKYTDLANIFAEYSFCTIENYIILQKVELVKKMILQNDQTLTEISFILNYSSIAHLSSQFKKITGLSPTVFKRIVQRRLELKL